MQATFHDFFHRCIAASSSEMMCLRKPFTVFEKSPNFLKHFLIKKYRYIKDYIFGVNVQNETYLSEYQTLSHCMQDYYRVVAFVVLPKSD